MKEPSRKALWESMGGCDCTADLRRGDRCSKRAVRCNGRLRRICADYKKHNYTFGSAR